MRVVPSITVPVAAKRQEGLPSLLKTQYTPPHCAGCVLTSVTEVFCPSSRSARSSSWNTAKKQSLEKQFPAQVVARMSTRGQWYCEPQQHIK